MSTWPNCFRSHGILCIYVVMYRDLLIYLGYFLFELLNLLTIYFPTVYFSIFLSSFLNCTKSLLHITRLSRKSSLEVFIPIMCKEWVTIILIGWLAGWHTMSLWLPKNYIFLIEIFL